MLIYQGLSAEQAQHYRADGVDAYDVTPEHAVSGGSGYPCRRCLRNIPKGSAMRILAHRPFSNVQPYAETGPIFLCADACERDGTALPPVLTTSPEYLVKGYGHDERIVYGTGAIVPSADIPSYADMLFKRGDIRFVDVRSARNNCWLVRIIQR